MTYCGLLIFIFCKHSTDIVSNFGAFPNFSKEGKFAASTERPKLKIVSASESFVPWSSFPCLGLHPLIAVIGDSQLYLGEASNSLMLALYASLSSSCLFVY